MTFKHIPYNDFYLKQRISYGSTATVYKYGTFTRPIALKAFSLTRVLDQPELMLKINNEIEMNKTMNNTSNFPLWYGVYQDSSNIYLAQQYVRGYTLKEIHAYNQTIDESYVLKHYAPYMANFVFDCHERDIIHRDLHLGNFVHDYYEDKIYGIDLGFAQYCTDNNKKKDDIWLLGVSLYRLMYGNYPIFSTKKSSNLIKPFVDSRVSNKTNDLLLSMMHFEAEKRPSAKYVKEFFS